MSIAELWGLLALAAIGFALTLAAIGASPVIDENDDPPGITIQCEAETCPYCGGEPGRP